MSRETPWILSQGLVNEISGWTFTLDWVGVSFEAPEVTSDPLVLSTVLGQHNLPIPAAVGMWFSFEALQPLSLPPPPLRLLNKLNTNKFTSTEVMHWHKALSSIWHPMNQPMVSWWSCLIKTTIYFLNKSILEQVNEFWTK